MSGADLRLGHKDRPQRDAMAEQKKATKLYLIHVFAQIYRIFDLFDVDSSASIEFDEFYLLISCFLAFKVMRSNQLSITVT